MALIITHTHVSDKADGPDTSLIRPSDWNGNHQVSGTQSEGDLALTDILTGNTSTSKHGFAPKLPNDAAVFLNGVGGFTAPSPARGINAQTGTSYSLTAGDNGKILTFNNGSNVTLTVPAGLGAGFNVTVIQLGAGTVTPTASSTTINQRQSFTKTAGAFAVAELKAYAANIFALSGDLQA